MTERVAVIVATFGGEDWRQLGRDTIQRLQETLHPQPNCFLHHHGDTLAYARNEAARRVETDWLIFCDADDFLHHDYVSAMLRGTGDIRQPKTRGVYPDGSMDGILPHPSKTVA